MRTTGAESSGCDLRMQILGLYPGLGMEPRNLEFYKHPQPPVRSSRRQDNLTGLFQLNGLRAKPRLIPGALEPR